VQEILDKLEGMLINGRAGTGKTYLINQLINAIKERGFKYACLAPTNKSARLIEGDTLDSLSFQSVFNNNKLVKWALSINYIIVDEISMVKEKFYRLLTNIKKINPKIIFFVCGDFQQLKPVNDSWKGDYENSPVLLDLCQNNKLVLTKCRRSDEKLFNLCHNVNEVNVEDFPIKIETNLNIAYYHSTRKQVNNECMERYLSLQSDEPIEIQEDEYNPKTQHLKLVKGMPIICHRTCKKIELLNSDRFVITSINNKEFEFTNELRIEKGEEPMKMEIKDFHRYFYLAYCITVHASQGETFKEPYTIYDWERMCKRGKYVSLSRGTEMNNIQIHVEIIESIELEEFY
jgi:ATP-dependent exoDNAse (exonuclease V) alpha subunit